MGGAKHCDLLGTDGGGWVGKNIMTYWALVGVGGWVGQNIVTYWALAYPGSYNLNFHVMKAIIYLIHLQY